MVVSSDRGLAGAYNGNVLRAAEVPQTRLGSGGGLLGWTTWINTEKPDRDAEDVILDTDLN